MHTPQNLAPFFLSPNLVCGGIILQLFLEALGHYEYVCRVVTMVVVVIGWE